MSRTEVTNTCVSWTKDNVWLL